MNIYSAVRVILFRNMQNKLIHLTKYDVVVYEESIFKHFGNLLSRWNYAPSVKSVSKYYFVCKNLTFLNIILGISETF